MISKNLVYVGIKLVIPNQVIHIRWVCQDERILYT